MTTPKHPMQPVVIAGDGVARFKPNKIVEYILARAAEVGVDLNHLAAMDNLFADEDYEQLAQLIGYSVSGFGNLFYASEEVVAAADTEVEKLLKSVRG